MFVVQFSRWKKAIKGTKHNVGGTSQASGCPIGLLKRSLVVLSQPPTHYLPSLGKGPNWAAFHMLEKAPSQGQLWVCPRRRTAWGAVVGWCPGPRHPAATPVGGCVWEAQGGSPGSWPWVGKCWFLFCLLATQLLLPDWRCCLTFICGIYNKKKNERNTCTG